MPRVTSAPLLETPRLILRGWEPADFDAYETMFGSAERTRYLRRLPDHESLCKDFERALDSWNAERGDPSWAIQEVERGAVVGWVEIVEKRPGPALGWMVTRDAEGKGYAAEAVSEVMRWARAELGATQFSAAIHPDNRRSITLAGRLGFQPTCESNVYGEVIFRAAS
jgi:RimJ/RimL family protein N-acetyltransferase